jgi:recombinational DNA repair protein (RecF pathway)
LSWQTEISIIEADLFLNLEEQGFVYRYDDLKRVIHFRHKQNRPIIIEGIFLLQLLAEVGIEPDYLIYVEKADHNASFTLREDFVQYQKRYRPKENSNITFCWSEE